MVVTNTSGGPEASPPQGQKAPGRLKEGSLAWARERPGSLVPAGAGSQFFGKAPHPPGKMSVVGDGSQHLWVLIPGSGVREYPQPTLRLQTSLPCSPCPVRPRAGALRVMAQSPLPRHRPALCLRWPFAFIRDRFSLWLAEHGTLDLVTDRLCALGQVIAPLCLRCHLCEVIGDGGRLCVTLRSSLVRGCCGVVWWDSTGGEDTRLGLWEVMVPLWVTPLTLETPSVGVGWPHPVKGPVSEARKGPKCSGCLA